MKLRSLTVAGFRGFGETYEFDLSADVIVVHGPNGAGKTSLFDAVLWAVTGSVDRLGGDATLVSRYSQFGDARVELSVEAPDGQVLRIVRRHDQDTTLTVEDGESRLSGATAEARLLELLWPDAAAAAKPFDSLARSVTRAVYLQQDQVRSFIEAEDEQGRFEIVGEIVGAGRVGELVRQLEGSRKAWTTATNRLRDEAEPTARRRAALRSELDALQASAEDTTDVDSAWANWLARVADLVSDAGKAEIATGGRARTADRIVEELRSAQRQAEQRLARHRELLQLIAAEPPIAEGLDEARQQLQAAEQSVREASTTLTTAEQEAAEERRRQVEASELVSSLAALAQLATRHLGDTCPVCQQTYDRRATEAHLRELMAGESAALQEVAGVDVEGAARLLRDAEQLQAQADAEVRRLERAEQARVQWLGQVENVASELGFLGSPQEAQSAALDVVETLTARIQQLTSARQDGEALSVSLARRDQSSRLAELTAQLPALDAELDEQNRILALRETASADAKTLHEALRARSENLVASELQRIEPLVQRIYASVDPHPSFRAVRFLTQTRRGRGHLWTSVEDTVMEISESNPVLVLSSSQLNVLAVVTFLALNLSVPTLPLQLAAFDDPLQSLDNVNLLGLADLLRRVRSSRQVMISTHDDRLAGLLERKLRPVSPDQRTTVIRMDGWSRGGPVISQHDTPSDVVGLRLLRPA